MVDVTEKPRDKLIIKVLYDTGMRVSAISNLKITDMNFKKRIGNIEKAKGGKYRKFQLSKTLNEELQYFITEEKEKYPDIKYIFTNYENKKLSTRSF